MSFSRYTFTPQILGRKILGTPHLSGKIHRACDRGEISYTSITLTEGVRLDHLSGKAYGTASLWWIIGRGIRNRLVPTGATRNSHKNSN